MMRDYIEVCRCCGSSDIQQEISFMVNPNTYSGILDVNDGDWNDYYYCNVCEDTCLVLELQKEDS